MTNVARGNIRNSQRRGSCPRNIASVAQGRVTDQPLINHSGSVGDPDGEMSSPPGRDGGGLRLVGDDWRARRRDQFQIKAVHEESLPARGVVSVKQPGPGSD